MYFGRLILFICLSSFTACGGVKGGGSSNDSGPDTDSVAGCGDLSMPCACVNVDCDDGDPCTEDICSESGECVYEALVCDDGNPCTEDSCEATDGCLNQAVPEGTACDDGNVCSQDDQCMADGVCGGMGEPLDCMDDDLCTDTVCDPKEGCLFSYNQASCDDGEVCTTDDRCEVGQCKGQAVPCDDSNACTVDTCDLGVGCSNTLFYPACAPQSWKCDLWSYGTDDGCDCDCGAADPDCDVADGNTDVAMRCGLKAAEPDQICNTWSKCVPTSWKPSCDPNDYDRGLDLNPQWSPTPLCPPFQMPGFDCDEDDDMAIVPSCETGCGIYDPDCVWGTENDCINPVESPNLVTGDCELPGWDSDKCGPPAYKYNTIALYGFNSGCDCECGLYDPDCNALWNVGTEEEPEWVPNNNHVTTTSGTCGNASCSNNSDCPVAATCNLSNNFGAEGPTPCDGADGCYCSVTELDPKFKIDAENAMVCAESGLKCVPDKWIKAGCDPLGYDEGIKSSWVSLGPTLGGYWAYTYPICDCACGIKDPDCDIPNFADTFGLQPIAATNTCPTEGATCMGPAGNCQIDGWTCDPTNYDSDDGCHCECGTWDPDCDMESGYDWQKTVYCGSEYAPIFGLDLPWYGGGASDPQRCDPVRNKCVPTGWLCPAEQYDAAEGVFNSVGGWALQDPSEADCQQPANELCNCGCGVLDPDCLLSGTFGVSIGCVNACHTKFGSQIVDPSEWEKCALADPLAGTCVGGGLKEEKAFLLDDGVNCDCDLGTHDPDCDKPGLPVKGCPEGYRCVDGKCNNWDRRAKVLFITGRNSATPPGGFKYWRNSVACVDCPKNPACYGEAGAAFCEETGACTPGDCQWQPGTPATSECCGVGDEFCACEGLPSVDLVEGACPCDANDWMDCTASCCEENCCDKACPDEENGVCPNWSSCNHADIDGEWIEKCSTHEACQAAGGLWLAGGEPLYCDNNQCNVESCETFSFNWKDGPENFTRKDFCHYDYLAALWAKDHPEDIAMESRCYCGPSVPPQSPDENGECSPIYWGGQEHDCELHTNIPGLVADGYQVVMGWKRWCEQIRNAGCADQQPLDDPWIVPQVENPVKYREEVIKHNIPVNWDGQGRIAWNEHIIVDALDEHCTGNSYCYVYTHSTGGLHIGNAISQWGNVKRWNIVKVFSTASAEGGSEGADLALDNLWWNWNGQYNQLCNSEEPPEGAWMPAFPSFFQQTFPVDCDLRPANARTYYDHDLTWGVPFRHAAGAYPSADESWGFTEFMLEYLWWIGDLFTGNPKPADGISEQNDGIVPFHSSCGCRLALPELDACSDCEPWEGHTWELEESGFGFGHNGGMRRIRWKNKSKWTVGKRPPASEYIGPGPWERWKAQVQYATNTYESTVQPHSGSEENPTSCTWEVYSALEQKDCYSVDPDGNLWIPWKKYTYITQVAGARAYVGEWLGFNAGNVLDHRWGPTMTEVQSQTVEAESWHIPGDEVCDCVDNDFDGQTDEGLDCNAMACPTP